VLSIIEKSPSFVENITSLNFMAIMKRLFKEFHLVFLFNNFWLLLNWLNGYYYWLVMQYYYLFFRGLNFLFRWLNYLRSIDLWVFKNLRDYLFCLNIFCVFDLVLNRSSLDFFHWGVFFQFFQRIIFFRVFNLRDFLIFFVLNFITEKIIIDRIR